MNLLNNFIIKGTDWLFRRKSPALVIFRCGVSILLLTTAGSLMVQLNYQVPSEGFSLIINASDTGLIIQTLSVGIGIILIIVGIAWEIVRYKQELKLNQQRLIIAIEQRGLRDTSDTPLVDAIPLSTLGVRRSLVIDIRDKLNDGKVLQPRQALRRISSINETLFQLRTGHSNPNITLAYGGIFPVPFTFLTGLLLDDENKIDTYDWDRNSDQWRLLDEEDDHKRFIPPPEINIDNSQEVVVAISASYPVDIEGIKSTFTNLPIFELKLDPINSNSHWSQEKQSALAMQFFELIKKISGKGIKTVHLIIAAPNSLVFRLGRAYDKRNLPGAIIYQYERSNIPPYPWGVMLPTHGKDDAEIIWTK